MDREIIKLNNQQWKDVAQEVYLEVDGVEVPIKEIRYDYVGSGRHTEHHTLVFQRVSDGKYFKVGYEESVKDSMGWDECNYGSAEAKEVFPKTIETIIYE